jgi:hypothetical protein
LVALFIGEAMLHECIILLRDIISFCRLLCVINLFMLLFLNDVYLFFSLPFILMC